MKCGMYVTREPHISVALWYRLILGIYGQLDLTLPIASPLGHSIHTTQPIITLLLYNIAKT